MTRDRISALFFLAVSLAYGFLAADIRVPPFAAQGVTARTLPYVLSGTGVVIALLMLVMRSKEAPPAPGSDAARGLFAEWGGFAWGQVILLGVNMAAYGFLLTRVGFMLSTSLFLIVGYWILGERRGRILLLASVPVVIVFWFLLNQLLGIYLGHLLGSWGLALFGPIEFGGTR